MSRGPINANVVRSGDVISIATGSNSYATNLVYNGATINKGSVCGTNVSSCMACGECKVNGGNAITNPITTVGSNSSIMTYTITGYNQTVSKGYTEMTTGTPLFFGDFVSLVSMNNQAWQTGPNISLGIYNDTIQLVAPLKVTDSDFSYQLWTFVNPANNQGVFNYGTERDISTYNVYYGNPYYLQSIGKAVKNTIYNYATLNNTGYDCVLSTQTESSGITPPKSGGAVDYNTTFIICDDTGAIPTSTGDVAVPPAGTPPSSGGLFGWGIFDLGIFSAISKTIEVVFYLIVFVIITLFLAFLLYILL